MKSAHNCLSIICEYSKQGRISRRLSDYQDEMLAHLRIEQVAVLLLADVNTNDQSFSLINAGPFFCSSNPL
jgi:hypothetical protein